MHPILGGLASAAALLCAATMGFAIQRGATCTVAAVDELLQQRRASRLLAMVEAAAWVAAGLLLARWAGLLTMPPQPTALDLHTVAGAALLGLGAQVNRGCVFGALARLGSGEWAYVATPLGYYLGCLVLGTWVTPSAVPALATAGLAGLLSALALAWTTARLLQGLRTPHGQWANLWQRRLWTPHAATAVIGVSFVLLLLLEGPWAYTDALAELAAGKTQKLGMRGALLVALIGGAAWGGWTAGRWRPAWPGPGAVCRCLAGGVLMAFGSLLIPGSNDGLILIGLPMFWPQAAVAFVTMCLSIAAAQGLPPLVRRMRRGLHGLRAMRNKTLAPRASEVDL